MSNSVERRSLRRILFVAFSAGVFLAGCVIAIKSFATFADLARAMPLLDQWDQPGLAQFDFAHLVAQHNEHRILFPRLIFAADAAWFGGRNVLNYLTILACVATSFLILLVTARRAGLNGPWLLWAAGVLLALSAWPIQIENFAWGFQTQFVGVFTAGLAAIVAICLPGGGAAGAIAAMLLSAVAVYTMASGAAVPVVVLLLAIACGRPRGQVVAVGLWGVALVGLYLVGYASPPQHSSFGDAGHHPLAIAGHILTQLGAPFGDVVSAIMKIGRPAAAMVVGLAGAVAFAGVGWTIVRAVRDEPRARARLALVGMMGFLLLASGLIAVGRVRFGLDQAFSSRYATPVLLFWMGLVLAIATAGKRARIACAVASVIVIALILRFEGRYVGIAKTWVAQHDMATPAFLSGVADAALLRATYPNPARPLQRRAELLADRLSVFSEDWARWIGTPLADHAAIGPADRCAGTFRFAAPLPVAGGESWRAEGTLAARDQTASGRIVLVDGAKRVVGYGLTQMVWPRRQTGLPDGARAWIGDFTAADASAVTAFVLLDGAPATACPIGAAAIVGAAPTLRIDPAPNAGLSNAPEGGVIDNVSLVDGRVVINGRALLGARAPALALATNLPVSAASLTTYPSVGNARVSTDPTLGDDGFEIVLDLKPGATLGAGTTLCLASLDPDFGPHRLRNGPRPDLCPG
ncbi:hypothetical protein [Segnochrobactrum spirostomi]|uniref:Transmembrane protein n=1 Tax=Segnochrobactrum spirostomi TaxID=2608987 RepID=A0A6A7XZJ0_9HYPH|nr:hypothetical protein [Segnochrobactrum spirostomi]MQT11973.1 hypothetical protein [Segnochrobactrum spirostomi]